MGAAALALLLALFASAACASSRRQLLNSPADWADLTGKTIGGWTYAANVTNYLMLAQDSCDINEFLAATPPNYGEAEKIYDDGKHNPKGTLKGFAIQEYYAQVHPLREKFINFYNDEISYLDVPIKKAFENALPEKNAERTTVIRIVAQSSILFQFSMHEVEAGRNKTVNQVANHTSPTKGAPHNVEEAWALWYGTPGCGLFAMAEELAKSFKTTTTVEAETISNVNTAMLAAYKEMFAAGENGNATGITVGMNKVLEQYVIMSAQGILRAAFRATRAIEANQPYSVYSGDMAEAAMHLFGIRPLLKKGPGNALNNLFKVGATPDAETYNKALKQLRRAFKASGFTFSAVGTLASTCVDGMNASREAMKTVRSYYNLLKNQRITGVPNAQNAAQLVNQMNTWATEMVTDYGTIKDAYNNALSKLNQARDALSQCK